MKVPKPEQDGNNQLSLNLGKVQTQMGTATVIRRQNPHIKVANAFANEQGRIPNNPLLAAGLAAIWKGGERVLNLVGGWSENESGCPVYYHTGKKGGRIVVYPNLKRDANERLPTEGDLWSFIKQLSPFTADVALAVLAQLCEPSSGDKPKYPLLESVRITADAILRYKGIQRWGVERRMLKERVFEEMERLRALHFDVEKVPAWDPATSKWNGKGFSWRGDRLFDIVKVEQYQESFSGGREQLEFSWLVRAGQWAYWWLNAQGRIWIGRMAKILLELDHQGAALAKKIGQRVVLLNEALKPGYPLCLRIDHLLEDLGELPSPETRGRNWFGRTRDRFDNAMLTLQEIGVFEDVEWPDGYGPNDNDRVRGWSKHWLASRVRVIVPGAPPDLLEQESYKHIRTNQAPQQQFIEKKKRKSYKQKKQQLSLEVEKPQKQLSYGKQVRQARKERGWSQKNLAKHLEVTASYLSQIENDKQRPSRNLIQKLNVWFEENTN